MKNQEFLRLLTASLPVLDLQFAQQFAALPLVSDPDPSQPDSAAAPILADLAERMGDNYPYFHPLYAGQMLKPPHPIARAAYALAMAINPNNHARDGGRATSTLEIEAVSAIARMFGFPQHLGHLTSGGTFANLEALWVAGQLHPNTTILASDQAHYTHSRISSVLKLPFETIPTDNSGRMDLDALAARLQQGREGHRRRIGTVVVTLGSTATGSVDALDAILALREQHPFRIHVDAAYGGYFHLSSHLPPHARQAFDCIHLADSIVIDPHKHGLQPYGCGCILFRDPTIGRFYQHDSPYTYFSSAELHLGEISLECSRAGAAAAALWATQQLLPLIPGGTFASKLDLCRTAAADLHQRLSTSPDFLSAFPPELDIVTWAVQAPTVEASSARAEAIFHQAAALGLHLALAALPTRFFPPDTWTGAASHPTVRCLRSVLMKPEHAAWLPRLWTLLEQAASL